MLNSVIILGQVTEVGDDRDAVIVTVKTGGREGRDGKSYEDFAACRFWGKAKEHASKATPGAMVKIDAKVTSRKSDRGGWFSSIEARYLEVLGAGASRPAQQRSAPSVDDTEPPF